MTTAEMATYAYDQIDQDRAELNAVSQSTYETSQTSTRRVGMCQVGASRKFVSEEAVAICDTEYLRYMHSWLPFGIGPRTGGCREAPNSRGISPAYVL